MAETFENVCKQLGQEHLVAFYEKLDEAGKKKLADQVANVDPRLIEMSRGIQKGQERGKFEPLAGMDLAQIAARHDEFKAIGIKAIQDCKVGAVLLAGGQGTRLGFDGPKGTYNIGLTKDVFIFERLIANLMEVTDEAKAYVPLYIMTSDKNNDATVSFFEEKNYFGYPKEYIKFFVQDMAPSVDFDGNLYMEDKDTLSLSPNGNGGWFTSMVKAGLLEDIHAKGIEWMNIFAVDNVLQRIADPVFVGATIDSKCVSGAKVVRKADPQERVGVLCLEDGMPSIAEYYEMTEEMINNRNADGELSYAFGVILNYLFRVDKLEDIQKAHMPVHIVEKKIPYMTIDGEYMKPEKPNGYKFEELVLDMIHLLDNCLPYEVDRKKEFAPIKNPTGVDSVESARELLKLNGVEL